MLVFRCVMRLKGTARPAPKGHPQPQRRLPFELAYRLISMFSAKGDTVVDPFWDRTTLKAAAAAGRNCIGYEIEPGFAADIFSDPSGVAAQARRRVQARSTTTGRSSKTAGRRAAR